MRSRRTCSCCRRLSRDPRLSRSRGVALAEGRENSITQIRTPVKAPNANAIAERWVRTARIDSSDADCLTSDALYLSITHHANHYRHR